MGEESFDGGRFSLWIPLSRARELAATKLGQAAYHEILRRLSNELLLARAHHIFSVTSSRRKQLPEFGRVLPAIWDEVASEDWVDENSMWRTDTVVADVTASPSDHYRTRFEFFGVRIAPEGLIDMGVLDHTAARPWLADRPAAQPPVEQAEAEMKIPPASPAALEAWFKAYKVAFTGAEDTEAKALESARGCFPGKSVSRDAVRALRGAQKRGPKSASAE